MKYECTFLLATNRDDAGAGTRAATLPPLKLSRCLPEVRTLVGGSGFAAPSPHLQCVSRLSGRITSLLPGIFQGIATSSDLQRLALALEVLLRSRTDNTPRKD